MLLLLALSIGIVGMVEKDMHGEWVVVQQQGIRAARTGGIGIIAPLLLLRGRRHTLYAFVTRPSTGPCGRPCEPCRGGLTRFALAHAAHDKPVWSTPSPITDKLIPPIALPDLSS